MMLNLIFVLNFSGNLLVTSTSSNFFFWNLVRVMMHLWMMYLKSLQFVVQLFFWCFTMGFHCLTKKKTRCFRLKCYLIPTTFSFLQAMRAGHCLQSAWNFWYDVVRNSSFLKRGHYLVLLPIPELDGFVLVLQSSNVVRRKFVGQKLNLV